MAARKQVVATGDGARTLENLKKAVAGADSGLPLYVQIATALSEQIAQGGVKPREILPSHRALALYLGVNLTTITKAFRYLKDRGVVSTQVGSGSAVRGRELDHILPSYERLRALPRIDLSVFKQRSTSLGSTVSPLLAQIALDPSFSIMLGEYHPVAGMATACAAGRRWFADWGIEADASHVAVTAGGQHGLLVALAATMKAGDLVLVPNLAYQGIKTAAQILGLGLIPVQIDDQGIVPEEIERHLANPRVKAIFIVPTLDNPTSVTLPLARRIAIAEIARKYSLLVIEDDVHRALSSTPLPSFWSLYPEATFHISSMAKTVAPGLRCGFMLCPPRFRSALLSALRGSMWMVDPLIIQLVERLIDSNAHKLLIDEQRARLVTRHAVALKHLKTWLRVSEPEGNCLWLDLPAEIAPDSLTDYLRGLGIGVAPSSIFAIGKTMHNGIRLYKSSADDEAQWQEAVEAIGNCIIRPPHPGDRDSESM